MPRPQTAALPDPKRKRKPTNLNKDKSNKRTKNTKISSLFPKRGNRNTKRTKRHKNKMTHGSVYVCSMYSFAPQTLSRKEVSLASTYTCSLLASSLPVFSQLIRMKIIKNVIGRVNANVYNILYTLESHHVKL